MIDRFETLPLASIQESASNPRRHFEQNALKELAENIKQHGVLSPLLVRPRVEETAAAEFNYYEIVFGARRYRAAKMAGLAEVPVRIRELTDQQVLEVQIVENVQRADVHPLDEALGYQALLDQAGYTVITISEKVGKSASYIYQRLKLADLEKPLQKAFFDNGISPGHAILLARLQPADQRRAFDECTRRSLSVRELARYIDQQIHLDLKKAPFPTGDANIVLEAGSCAACPKRTGNSPVHADAKSKNICTDPTCYDRKVMTHIKIRAYDLEQQEGRPVVILSNKYNGAPQGTLSQGKWTELDSNQKKCDWTSTGLVADGYDRGHEKRVCVNQKCPVHHSHSHMSDEEKQRRAKERREGLVREEVKRQVLEQVLGKAPAPLCRADLELIARETFRRMDFDHKRDLCKYLQVKPVEQKNSWRGTYRDYEQPILERIQKYSDKQLARFLLLVGVLCRNWDRADDGALAEAAKRYHVDAAAIERQVRADLQTSAKRKAKAA